MLYVGKIERLNINRKKGLVRFSKINIFLSKVEKSMMLLMACGKCGKKKCLSLAHFVFHKRAMLFHRFINRLLPPPF